MHKALRPTDLEEALDWMDQMPLIPFAGGTDLMIRGRNWQGASRAMKGDILFIQHLASLSRIIETEIAYHVGSCVTQTAFCESPVLPQYCKSVVEQMATPAIRNAATIGGNIANAARVADLLPLLYAVDAQVVLRSKHEERILHIADFETGKYQTAKRTNELIIEVIIPKLTVKRYLYKKMGQRRGSILSKVSFVGIQDDRGSRLAIGAINDTVVRSKDLEAMINAGQDVEAIISGYASLFNGSDDNRSTKRYRQRVALNLIVKWMEEIS